MRSDPSLGLEQVDDLPGLDLPGRFFQDGASQSGNERHHLFSNRGGGDMSDVSGVSGLDDPADGRAFAWLDFDRDGWLDVASVNANAPLFQLFRNEIGELVSEEDRGAVVVELEGGARAKEPGSEWSNRDAIGARVVVTLANGRRLVREKRAGEGFAAQNTSRLHFGLGAASGPVRVTVSWPSGRTTELADVSAGSLVRIFERGEATRDAYAREVPPFVARETAGVAPFELDQDVEPRVKPTLRVLTTFATWCATCLGELPQMALLRDSFPAAQVAFDGIPVDPKDSPGKLEEWSRRHQPAYRVRTDWSPERRAQLASFVAEELDSDGLPATVVTDGQGRPLRTQWGVPSVSTLTMLLEGAEARSKNR